MDKKYWDNYYHRHGKDRSITRPTSFAKFCLKNFFNRIKLNIIELGSGNGRDAIYFANHNHNVTAIDQSIKAIDIEKECLDTKIKNKLLPKALDFVLEDYSQYEKINIFYSRFTLHSITKSDEIILLSKVYNALENEGLFCIEARTIKDPLFGLGEFCGQNTYIYNGHKRRFIDSKIFRKQVSELGFKELFFIEQNNLSIYKNDNPILMRIILEKKIF